MDSVVDGDDLRARGLSAGFCDALARRSLTELRAYPKADRHCHSILGASLQSIRDWTGHAIESPPSRMADFDAMREYTHAHLYPHIRTQRGVEFTAERSIEEAIQDGVQILEMSIDVNFINLYGGGVEGFLTFIRTLVSRYADRLQFRPELGLSKNRPASAQVGLAMDCIDSAVFNSIDLYGNEQAEEPEAFAQLYTYAGEQGLKLKAHVGEFGDANLIERTLRCLYLDEIQHGVTAAFSKPLMDLLARKRIRLNVCPTSNVALSVAEDLAHHPIRTLHDHGVRVSINSDDKTVFNKTVTEEYLGLYEAGTLNAPDLDAIRRDSLQD